MPTPEIRLAQRDDVRLDVDKAWPLTNHLLHESPQKTPISKLERPTSRQTVRLGPFGKFPYFSPGASSSATKLRKSDFDGGEDIEPSGRKSLAQCVPEGLLS